MSTDEVDYKACVGNFLSVHTENTINEEAAELVQRILDGLQSEILDEFAKEIGADSSDSLQSAQQAVETVFEGPLQEYAVANAQRQLVLFESGNISVFY